MRPGSPFKCTNCGAQLTWRDTPVIECDYCHTRILMAGITAAPAGAKKKPNAAFLVVGAAAVAGVVLIAVRASGGKHDAGPASPAVSAASVPTPAPKAPAPPPADPAKPPALGKVVLEFGDEGTNAGQLTDAMALAVTPAGDIVVAETRTGRVQVFDAKGAYQRVITLPPSKLTKELSVFGADAAPDGKVVVSRAGDLLVLDVAAGTVTKTIPGDYPDVFYHGDVEIVPDGSTWAVTDRTGDLNLVHLSAAGKILAQQKNLGAQYVAIDGIGTTFLSKEWDHAVEVRDSKGTILRKFSQAGTAKIDRPAALALDGKGHVFVVDGDHLRVFDPEGAYLGELEQKGSIEDITVDSKGALYVLRSGHVVKYELTLPAKP